jgi:hypothetical protein
MIDKKALKKTVGGSLEPVGFVKKGQTWYFTGQDAIAVVNLQKWDFGERYFLNVGISLKTLGGPEWPDEKQCQIQSRATALFRGAHELLTRACSLEEATAEDLGALGHFLREELAPFCIACAELGRLRVLFKESRFERALVMKNAREILA